MIESIIGLLQAEVLYKIKKHNFLIFLDPLNQADPSIKLGMTLGRLSIKLRTGLRENDKKVRL